MKKITLKSLTKSQKINVLGNSFIYNLLINVKTGTPAIKIGTSDGGEEILASASYTGFNFLHLEKYFSTLTILYITITGTSTTDIQVQFDNF